MGPDLILLLTALHLTPPDTLPTFADPATQRLVERAMARHAIADTSVADYEAQFRYRISYSLSRRRWAQVPVAAVEEQAGTIAWQRPNDFRVDILGRRARARQGAYPPNSVWSHPWFAPRSVGDSVRLLGNEVPERAALHPLAADGPAWYRYALTDSVRIVSQQGDELRLVVVEVIPKHPGPSLIAGKLWLDAQTAEVVRLTFRLVGNELWVSPDEETAKDSASSRRLNSLVNRILTIDADLEYALQDRRYWMPYRQIISGRVEIPLMSDLVIPFEAITTFGDYDINRGRPIAFTVPLPDSTLSPDSADALVRARQDSIRAERRRSGRERPDTLGPRDYAGRWSGGGRYEIHRAPADSLDTYPDWEEPLALDLNAGEERQIRQLEEDLARLADSLPSSITGRRDHGIAYEKLADILRYNRVQGLSIGFGYEARLKWIAFGSVLGSVRYGTSDGRFTGELSLIRDAPSGRWTLSGYSTIHQIDPFVRGQTMANTFNGIFFAHDNGDYVLAQGGTLTMEKSLGRGLELRVVGAIEDQETVNTDAHSGVNDLFGGTGDFPPNPSVAEGPFASLGGRLEGYLGGARWAVNADLLQGLSKSLYGTARLYGEWRQPVGTARRGLVVSFKSGVASSPTLPQSEYQLGGLTTVRGFEYGFRQGQAFWAAQTDVTIVGDWIRPVLFIDVGQVGSLDGLFGSHALVGGGVGLSLLRGFIRFDLSHSISPDAGGLRADLVLRAVR